MNLIQSNRVDAGQSNITNELFEERYLAVRRHEKRICSNQELRMLPDIEMAHPHFKEWLTRKNSSARLCRYLKAKNKQLLILEVGCGNGWLSNQLAAIPGSEITGSDINLAELEQAASVFGYVHNLQFVFGDIRAGIAGGKKFDVIVFAAAIQYFSSLPDILNNALLLLRKAGEIHIIDSNFYRPSEVQAAKKRTTDYYKQSGFPEMSEHYFHHLINDLDVFNHRLLYDPQAIRNFLFGNRHPFPWICIKKD